MIMSWSFFYGDFMIYIIFLICLAIGLTGLVFGVIFPYVFPIETKLIYYYIYDSILFIFYMVSISWIIRCVIKHIFILNKEYIQDLEVFNLDQSIAQYAYDRLLVFKDYSVPPSGIEKHTWLFILDEMLWFLDSMIDSKYIYYSDPDYDSFISAKRLFINHLTDLNIGRLHSHVIK